MKTWSLQPLIADDLLWARHAATIGFRIDFERIGQKVPEERGALASVPANALGD